MREVESTPFESLIPDDKSVQVPVKQFDPNASAIAENTNRDPERGSPSSSKRISPHRPSKDFLMSQGGRKR